jgi:large-conductance mechanosensitive channel
MKRFLLIALAVFLSIAIIIKLKKETHVQKIKETVSDKLMNKELCNKLF